MKNINLKVKDKTLTITIDLSTRYGRSKSGKTIIIASTEGNVSVPGVEEIKVGVNCYTG